MKTSFVRPFMESQDLFIENGLVNWATESSL